MVDEQRDVFGVLAERRNLDAGDIEPVEKIDTELAPRHHGLKITMGACNDPDVDWNVVVSAYPMDGFFL